MRHKYIEEERVAKKISDMISDVRLNLDLVGIHLARAFPASTIHRLDIVVEAAVEEKGDFNERVENEFQQQMFNLIWTMDGL